MVLGSVDYDKVFYFVFFFFFKQKTAYEIGTGDWSSDVCSSDLADHNTNDQAYGDNVQNRLNFIDEQVHNFQVKIIPTASVSLL